VAGILLLVHAKHGGCVGVLDSILSSCHLLVLDEIVMVVSLPMAPGSSVVDIRVVAAMMMVLDLLLELLVAHGNDSVGSLLLGVLIADEHDVALVDPSVVRTAVGSLLVVVPSNVGLAIVLGLGALAEGSVSN